MPAFVILAAVVAIPLVLSLYSSFTAFQLTRPETITAGSGPSTMKRRRRRQLWAAFGRTVLLLTVALNLRCCWALAWR